MSSNLTNSEYYRLHGNLTSERIESLLEMDAMHESSDLSAVAGYIEEASSQFPAEDFLAEPIEKLHALATKVRGDNRLAVLAVAKMLDDIAQCTLNSTDYGTDELHKARKILAELLK